MPTYMRHYCNVSSKKKEAVVMRQEWYGGNNWKDGNKKKQLKVTIAKVMPFEEDVIMIYKKVTRNHFDSTAWNNDDREWSEEVLVQIPCPQQSARLRHEALKGFNTNAIKIN